MADAMVTARMSAEKKTAGGRVLDALGSNPSRIINELYDYLLEHKESPFAVHGERRQAVSAERWSEARDWLDGLKIEPDPEFKNLTTKEAKGHRLAASVFTLGGEEQ